MGNSWVGHFPGGNYPKIAITHLWHAIEPQTICHLLVKDKVAEQQILGKYSNCNSFGDTMDLLNSQNFKVAITQLSNMQQAEILLCDSLSKKIASEMPVPHSLGKYF